MRTFWMIVLKLWDGVWGDLIGGVVLSSCMYTRFRRWDLISAFSAFREIQHFMIEPKMF